MVTFEESRKRSPRGRPRRVSHSGRPRSESKDRKPSSDRKSSYSENKYGGRDSSRNSRGRRDFEMTRVKCSYCGTNCEVPFKPTTNKPIFCDSCFAKKDKGVSPKIAENDLDIINEKLNKIMKALDIK